MEYRSDYLGRMQWIIYPDGKHHVPHIHVICGDKESVFSLEGELIEGDIPQNKKKLVEAWIEIHKEDLHANWKLLDEGEQFFKIEPLR